MDHTAAATPAGIVFNLQKFSVHDGPGIRTLVFLKGCPLGCRWCSNPESQRGCPEVLYNCGKCIGTDQCRYCVEICPTGAIRAAGEAIVIDRRVCTDCGACAAVCPAQALEICGLTMSVEEVLDAVEEDSAFYTRSGGGITLSGGEPLMQADFAAGLLRGAKERGMDTALETSGFSPWENVKKVLAHVDTVFFDLKCLDAVRHKQGTGVDNEKILENFGRICAAFPQPRIVVRTPVIPGFNDREEDIVSIRGFLKNMPRPVEYELLEYHRFGESKYTALGRSYPLGRTVLDHEKFLEWEQLVKL